MSTATHTGTRRPYTGGRTTTPEDEAPKAIRTYPCTAHSCPMPGTIFTGTVEGNGACAYHYAASANDWPRITQVLKDWACVSDEVNAAREFCCDTSRAMDIAGEHRAMQEAWQRLQPALALGGWNDVLVPGGNGYGAWAYQLECFLGARIVDVMKHQWGRTQ